MGPAGLLGQSRALMQSMYPPEQNHFLSLDALTAPEIRFFAAAEGEATPGTGAIALRDGYAKVKSTFTAPAARGLGIADAILRRLIDAAASELRPLVRLEPGLDAAHRLYARLGFRPRCPCGY